MLASRTTKYSNQRFLTPTRLYVISHDITEQYFLRTVFLNAAKTCPVMRVPHEMSNFTLLEMNILLSGSLMNSK